SHYVQLTVLSAITRGGASVIPTERSGTSPSASRTDAHEPRLGDGESHHHAGVLVPHHVAVDLVLAGGQVVNGEGGGVARLHQRALGDDLPARIGDRHVVAGGAVVDEVED